MRRTGLQYNIIGGFSFYERMEVRDIIAYLKLALNPNDSIALGRVINSPPRGIGKTTIDELERRAKDYELSWWETISNMIEQPGSLGPRAISALKSFRNIINKLAKLAETPDESIKEPVSDVVRAAIIETGYEMSLRGERTDEAEGRLENFRNSSIQPWITTTWESKGCASLSTTPRSFPIRTSTSATRQSRL